MLIILDMLEQPRLRRKGSIANCTSVRVGAVFGFVRRCYGGSFLRSFLRCFAHLGFCGLCVAVLTGGTFALVASLIGKLQREE